MALNFRVTNVPGSMKLFLCDSAGIDLAAVAKDRRISRNVVLTPRFAAVQVWDHDAEENTFIVHLLFASGVVNQVGAKSEKRMRFWFAELRKRFFDVFSYAEWKPSTVRVTMCASTADLPSPFDVTAFMQRHGQANMSYEPDQFPGATYTFPPGEFNGNVIINAFPGSKKYVCTGALSEVDARRGCDRFSELVFDSVRSVVAPKVAATAAVMEPTPHPSATAVAVPPPVPPPPPPPPPSAPQALSAAERAMRRGRMRRAARVRAAGNIEPVAVGLTGRSRKRARSQYNSLSQRR